MINGMVFPGDVNAGWWEDMWLTKDQQAHQALQQGDSERAAGLAVDPSISGEAWYRSGEFESAEEAWEKTTSADAHYNRGNALAHMGELDAAIQAYDRALALEPNMTDAIKNKAIVEQMKEQEEQQQQEQQGDQGESSDSESSGEQQQGEDSQESQSESEESQESEQEGSEQESEQQEGESQDQGEPQMDYAEAWSEEDAQAMEQWLRRIPDDPGGLLRRKFRNQHQRRGAPEDEREAW
jgi:Ca-activated chloride channel family protein